MRAVLAALTFLTLFAVAVGASAQVEATARGQGYYVLIVDGEEVSNHAQEREALQHAVNALLADPAAVVSYQHRYVVDVTGGAPVTEPVEPTEPTDTVAPPPDPSFPNEPAGAVEVARWDGASKSLDGWGTWGGEVSLVSTDTPTGDGRVLRFDYPAGSRSAGVLTAGSFDGAPFSELYIMYRIRYAPDWEIIGHKNFYWGAADGSRNNVGSPTQYYATYESSGTALLNQQNASPSSRLLTVRDAWSGDPGRWVNLEIHAVAESAPGAGDGAVYYYHDGVLLGSSASARWTDPSDPVAGFDGFQWYTTRNTENTRPSWFEVDELYISGVPIG